MLKVCAEKALKTLSVFMEFILNYAVIPKNINISIIKPIKKDTKKAGFDLGNLRTQFQIL
jgi:hypothetical protein